VTHPFIACYRVSTDEQSRSGLGIVAQCTAVAEFLAGGGGSPVAEFTEVEGGERADRPARRR
jgi:DNA invertase Pin-like site-specific DNA recombinase